MALVLMQLGDTQFSVPGLSFNRLQRRYEYRWEPQWRIGSRPAQQFLGPGEESVDIRGTIYPAHPYSGGGPQGGWRELNDLRAFSETGEPQPLGGLVAGFAQYLGLWCVRMIRDEQEYWLPNGYPRKLEFSIDLVNYGADGMGLGAAGRTGSSPAVSGASTSTSNVPLPVRNPGRTGGGTTVT